MTIPRSRRMMPDNDLFRWTIYVLFAIAVMMPIRRILLNRENPLAYVRHDTIEGTLASRHKN